MKEFVLYEIEIGYIFSCLIIGLMVQNSKW